MSDNELPELPELVVLTGAGFSKAFGLPLASEFNTMLYNRLIDNKELTRRIIEERNFEQIYTDLQNEKSEHFKDFEKAVEDIFNNMHPDKLYIDDSLKNSFVNNFLKHYLYPKDKKLADKKTLHFFTLNQDILFESHKISHLRGANSQENKIDLLYPGLFHICAGQPRDFKNTSIEIKRKTKNEVMSEVIVNDEMFSEEYKNQENYYYNRTDSGDFDIRKLFFWKLHGSSNWKDENGNLMIFGTNKKEQIKKRPLLKFYMEEFEKVIQGKTLLIIGYSFNDSHINNIIFDAANKYKNTKIHIVSPEAKLNSNFYKKLFDAGKIPFMSCLKKGFNKKTNVFLHSYTLEDLFGFTPGENNFPFKLIELYNSLNK